MQVLLAGATGAIGRPLIRALTANGHTVSAIVRNPNANPLVRELGATPVIADVLDREALLRAVDGLRADAVIHQATALRDAKVARRIPADDPTGLLRTVGTANLLEAASVVGAGRFVAQSLILGYGYHDHGDRLITERDRFGVYDGGVADEVVRSHRTPRPIRLPAWMIRLAVPYIGALMSDTSMRISSRSANDELGWSPRYSSVSAGLAA